MNKHHKESLLGLAGRKIRLDCSMAQYTTLKVGGKCEALYQADDLEELMKMIAYLSRESVPYFVVGRGSNLLVSDKGIEGLVIVLKGDLAKIERENPDVPSLKVGAGMPLADLLAYCRKYGLGNLEWSAGIPGTVGGAVVMNAGAFGADFSSVVQNVTLMTPQGDLIKNDRAHLKFSYRHFEMVRGGVVVRVEMTLAPSSPEKVTEAILNYLKKRKESQPLDYPSAGSVFKNPPNEYAGRLIEQAGLKGKRIGGAMISEKHANFIVNTGGARAQDVLELICLARTSVKSNTGIELEPEIRLVGEQFSP
jgi:UDP-N-acetylmuramate dehydrogenase